MDASSTSAARGRLAVSLSAYGATTLPNALETLTRAGVTDVQLSVGVRPADHLRCLDAFPLRYSVHSNFPLDAALADYDLVRGRGAPASFARMLEFCASRGIRSYSFHTGRYRPAEMSPEDAYARFLENLQAVRELADAAGVAIAVETMYPMRGPLRWVLDDEASIRRFLADACGVGLVADAAHVHIGVCQGTMGPTLFDELLAHESLAEVHISANDGVNDHHRPLTEGHATLARVRNAAAHVPVIYEGRMNGWPAERVRAHVGALEAELWRRAS